MARTPVAITPLTANAATTVATSAIDVANGHTITNAGKNHTNKLLFRVNNTFAGPKNVTIKAGANPIDLVSGPAHRSKLGDLILQVPASTSQMFGPFESSRFNQADQCFYIDYEAATTGTIEVYLVPQNV